MGDCKETAGKLHIGTQIVVTAYIRLVQDQAK